MLERDWGVQAGGGTRSLIRWGAVFAGVVLGLSLLMLMTALWLAIGYGEGNRAVANNIGWYVGVSGIVAMLIGGVLAGWLSGVPGAAPGFFNGLAVWGLTLIGSVAIGLPGVLSSVNLAGTTPAAIGIPPSGMWAPFVSLLIGAIAAGLGGALGGETTRPAGTYTAAVTRQHADAPGHDGEQHRRIDLDERDTAHAARGDHRRDR